jgi:putative SOS response-associated peptidase YedK
MCGRFSLDRKAEAIQARFKVKLSPEVRQQLPLFNIAPGQKAACIVGEELQLLEWGLAGKGVDGKSRNMINARSETVTEKWPFKTLMSNRCLVVSTGFFEWKSYGKTKIPFLHQLADHALFAMAGLYEKEPDTGHSRFTILTRAAGPQCAPYHDRMPLILNPDQEKTWLSLPAIQPDEIQKWSESEEPPLDIFSVSQRLNKSFENDSTLLQAEAVKVVQQLSIF